MILNIKGYILTGCLFWLNRISGPYKKSDILPNTEFFCQFSLIELWHILILVGYRIYRARYPVNPESSCKIKHGQIENKEKVRSCRIVPCCVPVGEIHAHALQARAFKLKKNTTYCLSQKSGPIFLVYSQHPNEKDLDLTYCIINNKIFVN